MVILSTYKVICLPGTVDYVISELTQKFPSVKIDSKDRSSVTFISEKESLESFRSLYSPIKIVDEGGKEINLSRREWRKGFIPAGINPSLAYIMCMIAEFSPDDILLDPFCGSSVIPISALKYFNIKRVICSDISSKAIFQSKINFENANIEMERYKLFKSDVAKVSLSKKNIDRIVSNLPFGIRTGNHEGNINLYSELENLADRLLRTRGKLVLLTQEKNLLRNFFRKDKWNVKSVVTVDQGGLKPDIFLITRRVIS